MRFIRAVPVAVVGVVALLFFSLALVYRNHPALFCWPALLLALATLTLLIFGIFVRQVNQSEKRVGGAEGRHTTDDRARSANNDTQVSARKRGTGKRSRPRTADSGS